MAEIEKASLQVDFFSNLRQFESDVKSTSNSVKNLEDRINSWLAGFGSMNNALEKHLNTQKAQLAQVESVLNSKFVANLKTFQNLMSGKTAKGKEASRLEWLTSISGHLKNIQNVLQMAKLEAEGFTAAINKAVIQGNRSKLLFGTEKGRIYSEHQLERMGFKIDAENRYYDSDRIRANEELKARNKAEKETEAIRRSTLSEAQRQAEDLARSQEKVQRRLGTIQLQVMSNYWVINRLASGYKALLNYTIQYDEELHQLQAISAMSNASLDKTRQTIEAVAVSTEFTSLELAKASTVLAQAGLSATQIQNTLPAIAKLATATGTDLNTATDTITSTMNIYNLQLSEAERVTNALTTAMNESKATIPGFQTAIQYAGNFAAQLGMSFEETAAAISAATQAGIRSKSMLGTGLRAVLTEFLKPTKKLISQLESVGLTIEDIDVKTKGYVNVLKTLKAAGFGAAEAFRGMERRGAAFLAAQLNQTDFMDNLRLQMAGSAAASKANETQMEALAKQIKNFQNVLGTAGTKGLTPFIKLLSQMLRVVNELSQTKLGGGIFSLLLTGGGAFATVKSWQMLVGSFNGVMRGLGLLTGITAQADFKTLYRFIRLEGVKIGQWQTFLKLLKGFRLSFSGWATLIATVVAGVYQLGEAFDWWLSGNEKILRQMEEAKGKKEEIQDTVNVIDQYLGKLITDREKLESLTERQILATDIVTRVPEAAKYFDILTASVDDLTNALIKLKGVKLGDIAEQAKKEADAAYAMITTSGLSDITSRTNFWGRFKDEGDAQRLINDWNNFVGRAKAYSGFEAPDITKMLGRRHLPGMALEDSVTRFAEDLTQKEMSDVVKDYINTLAENAHTYEEQQEAIRTLTATMAGSEVLQGMFQGAVKTLTAKFEAINLEIKENLWKDFGDSINNMVNKTKNVSGYFDERFLKPFALLGKEGFKLNPNDFNAFDQAAANLVSSREDLRNIMNYNSLLEDPTGKGRDKLYNSIKRQFELTEDQLTKLNDKDELRNLSSELAKSQIPELFERLGNQIEAAITYAATSGKNITGLDQAHLENNLEYYKKSMNKASTVEEATMFRDSAKETLAELNKIVVAKANEKIKEYENNDLLKQANQNVIDASNISLKTALEDIEADYNKVIGNFNRGANRIDPLTLEINKFFNALDEGIKKISTTYREAIKPLEEQLAHQEGVIKATSQYYGSNNPLVTYEQNRKKRMEEGQNSAYIAALEERLNALEGQRQALRENKIGKTNIYEEAAKYQENFKRYQELTASGNYGEALKLQKQLDKVSAAAKKVATKDDELTKAINEAKEELEKRRTWRDQMESYSSLGIGEQISKGVWAPMDNYIESTKEQGLHTLAGSAAYLSSGVIDEIDSGFTTMFKDIISNSKSAGDAFKAFGRQVLETIRDIAIQMAVRQGLSAIFSAFMPQSPGLSVGETQGNLTRLSATGGIVNGPVKNRDSVNMKLMPGEYVLKKSAVDVIGRDYLDSLNTNAAATLNASAVSVDEARGEGSADSKSTGGTVNVYVVGQEQQQAMTPSDVLVTITQDMLTGGQTKRLVKSIAMGAL